MSAHDHLKPLLAEITGPAVSIFLPTHVAGREIRQDPIRLRNLLGKAQAALVDGGLRGPEAEALLRPGHALVEDDLFWRHQQQGLAVFIAPGTTFVRHLPVSVGESWHVGSRFQIRPLLPVLPADGRFVVAAISLKDMTAYEGGGGQLRPVALADLPRGMDNLFDGGPDAQGEDQARSDRTVRKPATANAADAPANADAGSQKQVSNDEAIQYLKQIAACLEQYLGGSGVPLVVVADERLAGHFRRVCHYPVLVEPMIMVPPDSLDPATLHSHAHEVLRPRFDQARRDALDRVRQGLGGSGGTTTTHPAEIVTAALQGRVDTLLLRQGGACWGRWLPKEQTTILHHARQPGDEDLLDMAAAHTMVNSGQVFELDASDMPTGQVMAVLLRF